MTQFTRLEKTYYRLQAQILCLNWAFEQIKSTPGVIIEIGLGLGRTYQHTRRYLPEREMVVFEREVHSYEDCTPPDNEIIVGDITSTLVENANRFKGKAALINSDVGSFDKKTNREKAAHLNQLLLPYLGNNTIVLSDLELDLQGCTTMALPGNARKNSYYLYKKNQ